jgi:hypothetical protein
VALAATWNAWTRPSPDLAHDLRVEADSEKRKIDPNFEAHLPDMLKKGASERPSYDLPSELRLLKFKNMASVKRLAAKAIREVGENLELAAEVCICLRYAFL